MGEFQTVNMTAQLDGYEQVDFTAGALSPRLPPPPPPPPATLSLSAQHTQSRHGHTHTHTQHA